MPGFPALEQHRGTQMNLGHRAHSTAVRLSLALSAGVIVSTTLVVLPAGGAAPVPVAPTSAGAAAIYFRTTESFLVVKRRHAGRYNWTEDGCSVPPTLKVSVPALQFASTTFAAQCAQHDFAYRNFGGSLHLDRSEARRASVDRFFYRQMRARCEQPDVVRARRKTVCRLSARAFYLAVRSFGRL